MIESSFIDTPRGPIHVRRRASDGARQYVMVHGLGGSAYNWDLLGPHLDGSVTALDLPGFGHSPPQQGDQLDRHVEAVLALTDRIDGPITLVGNSMGGMVAEEVAAARPVDALVLIAPATPLPLGARPSDPTVVARLLAQGLPVVGSTYTRRLAEQGNPADQVRRMLDIVAGEPSSISPEYFASSERLVRLRRHMPWAYDSFSASARSVGRRLLARRRFGSVIDRIEAPTLLLWGTLDRLVTPSSLRALADRRPDWTAVELEGIGHVPMLEAPATTADLILDWLADGPAAAAV